MSESISQTEITGQAPDSVSAPDFQQTSVLVRTARANLIPAIAPSVVVPDENAELTRYVHSFRRRWLMAIILGIPMAILAGYAAWYFQTQMYEATAILRVASVESPLIFETADNNRSNTNTSETYKRTQRQWMRSRFVISRALRDVPALSKIWVFRNATDPVDWLELNLNVTFPDESEVMNVSLAGENPDGLNLLVNGVVQAYFDEIVFAERNRKLERLNSLELAYNKAQAELRNKRTELKQLVERVGTGDSSALTIVQQNSLNQFAQFQQHYVKVRFDLMQAQNEFDVNEAAARAIDADVPLSDQELLLAMRTDAVAGQIKAERQKILDIIEVTQDRVKKSVATEKLDDHARRLKACDERLEARKQALRLEMIEHKRQDANAGLDALKRRIALLTVQENQLLKKVRELEAEAKQVGRSSIDVEMMRQEILAVQDVLGRLGGELERTRVELQPDSKTGSTRVSLMNEAESARPVSAKAKLAKTAGAGIVGFMLPLLFVVWLDARKNHINSGSEIEHALGLSVIGSVPRIPHRIMRNLGGPSPHQQYWRTMLAESVDSTAAVLLQGVQSGTCRMIMVSSANASEGKTTLSAHLATSLAGAGLRTALVDFDLRRPSLHRVLGLSLEPGVVDLLKAPEALESAIQATQIPNLMFIPAGRWNSSGLARLAPDDLKRLFDRLRTEYDFIVVDTSPILPVVDTRLVAKHVDSVVLSVMRDATCAPQLRAACEILEMFNVPILGVVMTGARGGGYGGYGYGYGYDPYIKATTEISAAAE